MMKLYQLLVAFLAGSAVIYFGQSTDTHINPIFLAAVCWVAAYGSTVGLLWALDLIGRHRSTGPGQQ
jgi:uncharacterized membrane protein YjjP (DUF1212 family)